MFRRMSRQRGGVVFGWRRRDVARLGLRFCDGCGEVTTAAQRAARRLERQREQLARGWLAH